MSEFEQKVMRSKKKPSTRPPTILPRDIIIERQVEERPDGTVVVSLKVKDSSVLTDQKPPLETHPPIKGKREFTTFVAASVPNGDKE